MAKKDHLLVTAQHNLTLGPKKTDQYLSGASFELPKGQAGALAATGAVRLVDAKAEAAAKSQAEAAAKVANKAEAALVVAETEIAELKERIAELEEAATDPDANADNSKTE